MASAALVVGCNDDGKSDGAPKLESVDQKVSYLIGQNIGGSIKQNGINLEQDAFIFGLNEVKAVAEAQSKLTELQKKAPESLTKAETAEIEKLRAAVVPRISPEDADKIMKEFQASMMKKKEDEAKKLGEVNKAEGDKFLTENKAKDGVKVTESGLQYKVITEGTGVKPKATDRV